MTQSTTKKTGAFALMIGLLFAAGCGGGAEGADAADNTASVAAAPAADEAGGGEQVYGSICVTCHQADGTGLQGAFPPLAGSAVVTGDPEVSIKIVLSGLTGEMTRGGATYNGMMTPWGGTMSDADIADVLTYVRSNFGNSAGAVTESEVAEVRAATASQTTPYTTEALGIAGE